MTAELLYRFAVIFHVLAAVVWVGGVIFIGMVAVPAAKKLDDGLRRKLLDELGRRFRTIGWSCLGVLVVTGTYLTFHWGATVETLLDLSFFEHGHTRKLGYKLLLVIPMLIVSALHDFWLGPRATKEGRTEEQIASDRRLAAIMGRVTGVLVILIVVLAVLVARPWA